ncbi:MAG: hypothetical protein H0X63_06030 [Flavobacteriales bacterium]|nr:hypothetical protein [Flavobacteriales bacterium]
MGFETPFGQSAIFIYQIFKNNKTTKDADLFEFAKELMTFPKQFSFAYEINNWLRSGERKDDKLFSVIQFQELAEILTNRAIKEAGEDSIFEKFSDNLHYLGHTWAERDKESFDNYVKSYLDQNSNNVISLIKSYVPTIRNTAKPKPYKGDLTKDRYTYLVSFFDKNLLFGKIKETVTIEELEKDEDYWEDYSRKDFSEINMLRQFMHWYNEEEKNGR